MRFAYRLRVKLLSVALLIALVGAASFPQDATQKRDAVEDWPEATPESVGLDREQLASFDAELAGDKYGHMDSLVVIRCGKLVWDRKYPRDYDKIYGGRKWLTQPPGTIYDYFSANWHPYYKRGAAHTMQSVSKSVTSVTFGAAMLRGEFHATLDTLIMKFFDAAQISNLDDRKRRITLRHVLTMTSGIDWNEDLPYGDPNNSSDQMEASADWIKFVINRPMAFEPGTHFAYTSGGAEVLGYIFEKATGKDIQNYARQYVFEPLGIKDWYWKRSPTGLTDTEGGLYLRSEDLAKIGYLYLKSGNWRGKQIVSPEWVKMSVEPSVQTAEHSGSNGYSYGFQWWMLPIPNSASHYAWLGRGFGGQKLLVISDLELILVHTAWNILDSRSPSGQDTIDRMMKAADKRTCAAN
jgi:CubicO group peptidase (beta-lactamase class C family)